MLLRRSLAPGPPRASLLLPVLYGCRVSLTRFVYHAVCHPPAADRGCSRCHQRCRVVRLMFGPQHSEAPGSAGRTWTHPPHWPPPATARRDDIPGGTGFPRVGPGRDRRRCGLVRDAAGRSGFRQDGRPAWHSPTRVACATGPDRDQAVSDSGASVTRPGGGMHGLPLS